MRAIRVTIPTIRILLFNVDYMILLYDMQVRSEVKRRIPHHIHMVQVPIRYVPRTLKQKDQRSQINMIMRSRKAYQKGKYVTRKKIPSFKNRPSSHVTHARRLYGVESVLPSSRVLSRNSGCSINTMKQIVRKGEGAYFSSGSRPNQTAKSWGIARLAASLTGSKSATIDYSILETGCDPRKPAIRLAKQARKRFGQRAKSLQQLSPKQTSFAGDFGTGKSHAKRRYIMR